MNNELVLLTGANGFVGKFLCRRLLAANYSVRSLSRHKFEHDPRLELQLTPEFLSIDSKTLLRDVRTVIHLAARVHVMQDYANDPLAEFRKVNVNATLHLANQAAKAGAKRFIFISSVKVNGERTEVGKPFTEIDVPNPQDAYSISKLEAEQGLLKIANDTGMEVVIIRPPLIYGPGVKANFASLLSIVKKGIPLPLGTINNKRSFLYVENLVSFILHCIHHPLAVNQTFLISDGQDLSTTELLKQCASAMGVKLTLLPMPQKWLEISAALLGKRNVAQRLCGNLQLDITKARTLLGWKPPYSVTKGLKATVSGLTEK